MTDYINPDKLYPDDPARRIDRPPGNDSIRPGRDDSHLVDANKMMGAAHPPAAGGGRMNREEAAEFTRKLLARAEINAFPSNLERINNIPAFYFEAVLSALLGPQPDPTTGLVPCGCGGKAGLHFDLRDYDEDGEIQKFMVCAGCDKCKISTPEHIGIYYRGVDEANVEGIAKDAWNRAMGWKGGAE